MNNLNSKALSSSLNDVLVVHAKCDACNAWTTLKLTDKNYGTVTNKSLCENCNITSLNARSTISNRSYMEKIR